MAQLFMFAAPFTVLTNVFNGILQARSKFAEANVSQWDLCYWHSWCFHYWRSAPADARDFRNDVSGYERLGACWLLLECGRTSRSSTSKNDPRFDELWNTLVRYGYFGDAVNPDRYDPSDQSLEPEKHGALCNRLSAARLSDLFSTGIVSVVFPKAVSYR